MKKPAKRSAKRKATRAKPREVWALEEAPVISEPTPTAEGILEAHQSTHGDFSENARVMQGVKRVLRSGVNWTNYLDGHVLVDKAGTTIWRGTSTLTDVQAEALEMIIVKLGRIVSGDPNNPDHWLDIEGYARLARERL